MADTDRVGGHRYGGLANRADVVARLAARASKPVLASDRGAMAPQVAASWQWPRRPNGRRCRPVLAASAARRRATSPARSPPPPTPSSSPRSTTPASTRSAAGPGLTYLPFIARAVIDTLPRYPHLNAWVVDDGLQLHPHVNLGIAVDLDFEGLIVPVVHAADELRLPALAARMTVLAERARSRRLTPDDVQGGTFTITNPGGYGTAAHRTDHQPAASGDRVHRRGADAPGRPARPGRRLADDGAAGREPLDVVRPPRRRRGLRVGVPGVRARH